MNASIFEDSNEANESSKIEKPKMNGGEYDVFFYNLRHASRIVKERMDKSLAYKHEYEKIKNVLDKIFTFINNKYEPSYLSKRGCCESSPFYLLDYAINIAFDPKRSDDEVVARFKTDIRRLLAKLGERGDTIESQVVLDNL